MGGVLVAATLAALGIAEGQAPPKPRVAPFFSTVVEGPAFFVECQNVAGTSVSSGAADWVAALRLDGEVLPDPGGSIGAGLTTDVPPGGIWRGIVALRRSGTGTFPAVKFGALTRISRVVSLADGRHTLAVRCGETWSDDLEFYWETEHRRPGGP